MATKIGAHMCTQRVFHYNMSKNSLQTKSLPCSGQFLVEKLLPLHTQNTTYSSPLNLEILQMSSPNVKNNSFPLQSIPIIKITVVDISCIHFYCDPQWLCMSTTFQEMHMRRRVIMVLAHGTLGLLQKALYKHWIHTLLELFLGWNCAYYYIYLCLTSSATCCLASIPCLSYAAYYQYCALVLFMSSLLPIC